MDNVLNDIKTVLNEISSELKGIIHSMMESDEYGINWKVNKNTLVNSDIYQTLSTKADESNLGLIRIFINDYVEYIERGRPTGIWPPVNAIAEWAQRKGLPSDNGHVYLYCKSIYENGIRPRPFLQASFQAIDDYIDDWFNGLFGALIGNIDDFFNT